MKLGRSRTTQVRTAQVTRPWIFSTSSRLIESTGFASADSQLQVKNRISALVLVDGNTGSDLRLLESVDAQG